MCFYIFFRSTFKENNSCPNQLRNGHWLSSLTECLSLRVEPGGVAINSGVIEVGIREALRRTISVLTN